MVFDVGCLAAESRKRVHRVEVWGFQVQELSLELVGFRGWEFKEWTVPSCLRPTKLRLGLSGTGVESWAGCEGCRLALYAGERRASCSLGSRYLTRVQMTIYSHQHWPALLL